MEICKVISPFLWLSVNFRLYQEKAIERDYNGGGEAYTLPSSTCFISVILATILHSWGTLAEIAAAGSIFGVWDRHRNSLMGLLRTFSTKQAAQFSEKPGYQLTLNCLPRTETPPGKGGALLVADMSPFPSLSKNYFFVTLFLLPFCDDIINCLTFCIL